jgi:hypothetical protein
MVGLMGSTTMTETDAPSGPCVVQRFSPADAEESKRKRVGAINSPKVKITCKKRCRGPKLIAPPVKAAPVKAASERLSTHTNELLSHLVDTAQREIANFSLFG